MLRPGETCETNRLRGWDDLGPRFQATVRGVQRAVAPALSSTRTRCRTTWGRTVERRLGPCAAVHGRGRARVPRRPHKALDEAHREQPVEQHQREREARPRRVVAEHGTFSLACSPIPARARSRGAPVPCRTPRVAVLMPRAIFRRPRCPLGLQARGLLHVQPRDEQGRGAEQRGGEPSSAVSVPGRLCMVADERRVSLADPTRRATKHIASSASSSTSETTSTNHPYCSPPKCFGV